MDNYYTSVQLLQELRLKGLYGRGTIRANSKHYPAHTILHKDDCTRGDYRQAVSHDHSMLAASWCDGNVVNMVSNADSTNVTTVTRMVGSEKQPFPAPECVAQCNANMQGVDRLDQIRGRFSTSDGHSYKRWHKKLALALIDVARSNAYLTRRLIKTEQAARDPHRKFVMELVGELLNGQWKNAPSDGRMLYSGEMLDDEDEELVGTPSSQRPIGKAVVLATACTSVSSRQMHADSSKKRRRCIVCRWEGRYPTEVTNYCLTHGVCLCQIVHNHPAKPWMCPSTTSTCWDNFHQFYYPNDLFTEKGNVRRHSALAKLKATHEPRPEVLQRPRVARQIAYGPGGCSASPGLGVAATHRLGSGAAQEHEGGADRGGTSLGSDGEENNVVRLAAFGTCSSLALGNAAFGTIHGGGGTAQAALGGDAGLGFGGARRLGAAAVQAALGHGGDAALGFGVARRFGGGAAQAALAGDAALSFGGARQPGTGAAEAALGLGGEAALVDGEARRLDGGAAPAALGHGGDAALGFGRHHRVGGGAAQAALGGNAALGFGGAHQPGTGAAEAALGLGGEAALVDGEARRLDGGAAPAALGHGVDAALGFGRHHRVGGGAAQAAHGGNAALGFGGAHQPGTGAAEAALGRGGDAALVDSEARRLGGGAAQAALGHDGEADPSTVGTGRLGGGGSEGSGGGCSALGLGDEAVGTLQ